jgi:serine/threonine protein kinase
MKQTYVKDLTPKELQDDTSEGFILSQLNHPHIVKLYESFFENDYFYVITEYCEVILMLICC